MMTSIPGRMQTTFQMRLGNEPFTVITSPLSGDSPIWFCSAVGVRRPTLRVRAAGGYAQRDHFHVHRAARDADHDVQERLVRSFESGSLVMLSLRTHFAARAVHRVRAGRRLEHGAPCTFAVLGAADGRTATISRSRDAWQILELKHDGPRKWSSTYDSLGDALEALTFD